MKIELRKNLAYSLYRIGDICKGLEGIEEFGDIKSFCSENIVSVEDLEDALTLLFKEKENVDALPDSFSSYKKSFNSILESLKEKIKKSIEVSCKFPAYEIGTGFHYHTIDWSESKTNLEGNHQHVFNIGDSLVYTESDGNHEHGIFIEKSHVDGGKHFHKVKINDSQYSTIEGGDHDHSMTISTTSIDGNHKHILKINDKTYESITIEKMFNLFPEMRQSKYFNGPEIEKLTKKVKPVLTNSVSILMQESTEIQSVLFDKNVFTIDQAKTWLQDHGFYSGKLDETENTLRFRQEEPELFKEESFRTITLTDGIKAVIGIKKEETKKQNTIAQIRKRDEEKRLVYGVVLQPNDGGTIDGKKTAPLDPDSHKDVYSAEEIEKTAHEYMRLYRSLGEQHMRESNEKAVVVESYISPVDFDGENKEKVLKGSWILVVKVFDDTLWSKIKSGHYTGFSMEGAAFRQEEKL